MPCVSNASPPVVVCNNSTIFLKIRSDCLFFPDFPPFTMLDGLPDELIMMIDKLLPGSDINQLATVDQPLINSLTVAG